MADVADVKAKAEIRGQGEDGVDEAGGVGGAVDGADVGEDDSVGIGCGAAWRGRGEGGVEAVGDTDEFGRVLAGVAAEEFAAGGLGDGDDGGGGADGFGLGLLSDGAGALIVIEADEVEGG